MILKLCLMTLQSTIGMENDEIQELPLKKSEQGVVEKYIALVEEKGAEADTLGSIADELTDKADNLALNARAYRGNIRTMNRMYKEAEYAHSAAAEAHKTARNVELEAAKLERTLLLLATKLNNAELKKEYKNRWETSVDNAQIGDDLITMYLVGAQRLRFEGEKKIQAIQELFRL